MESYEKNKYKILTNTIMNVPGLYLGFNNLLFRFTEHYREYFNSGPTSKTLVIYIIFISLCDRNHALDFHFMVLKGLTNMIQ